MTDWRLAMSLVTLFAEINAAQPDRPRQTDGSIASAAHTSQNPGSDHEPRIDVLEPTGPGVVTAVDITTADFTDDLAEDLRLMGKAGDGRIKYVIYKGRICSVKDGWAWRPYTPPPGGSDHYDHIHLSVSSDPAQYDRTDPWQPQQEDDVTPQDKQDIVEAVLDKLLHGGPNGTALVATHGDMVTLLRGDRTHLANLTSIAKAVKVPGV